jgi:DNA-directed RNA polymerase specialized sigma24 family protein
MNQQPQFFKKYAAGRTNILPEFLSNERLYLYDYLMRMIGQMSRAYDTVEEVFAIVQSILDRSDTYEDFQIVLFKTGRNFCRDVWDSDTNKLANEAYGAHPVGSMQALVKLEHALRALPPRTREIVLLKGRYGLSSEGTSEITGLPPSEVEQMYARSIFELEASLPELTNRLEQMLVGLQNFPQPSVVTGTTQNLSDIMHDFQKTSRFSTTRSLRLVAGILIICAAAAAFYFFK